MVGRRLSGVVHLGGHADVVSRSYPAGQEPAPRLRDPMSALGVAVTSPQTPRWMTLPLDQPAAVRRRSPRAVGRASGQVVVPIRLPIDEVPAPEYSLDI